MISVFSSGLKDASELICDYSTQITGVMVITDGSNDATATVFEGSDDTGKVICGPMTVAGAGNFGGMTWEHPVSVHSGLYLKISGTGARAIVYYKDKAHL